MHNSDRPNFPFLRSLPIAIFDHAKDNVPKSGELSWDELADSLGGPVPLLSGDKVKVDLDAFSLVKYRPNTLRDKSNVESISAIVLDLDHVPRQDFVAFLRHIAPLKYIIYSSYSHSSRYKIEETFNCRVILAIDEPIRTEDWPSVWAYFVSTCPLLRTKNGSTVPICDTACRDQSRIYFAPGSNDIDSAFNEVNEGVPLCTADLVTQSRTFNASPAVAVNCIEADSLSRADLLDSIKRLSKSKSEEVQQAAKWLRQMADGDAWCSTPGQRHAVLLKMTLQLEALHPLVSCEALASVFAPSLATMARAQPRERALDLDEVVKALEGARERRKADAAETAAIRAAMETGGKGKYSEGELDAICESQGISREELEHRWIMQAQNGYYVLTPDGYTNVASSAEMPVLLRELRRAPVHVFNIKKDGLKLRPLADITHDCGGRLQGGVVADMTVASNVIDEDGAMHESICQLRKHKDIVPERQPEFEGLISVLAVENDAVVIDRLQDWLATATRTERVTCALHLMGKTGGGKTVLANGLAQLWKSSGSVPLAEALKTFNETILTCPVLLADEEKPKGLTAANFRALLGTESFSVSRKFRPNVMLKGAFRVICTANDPDFFKFKDENLSADALAATAPRILTVYFGPKAIAYMAGQKDWLSREVVAKHALWLRDNRKVVAGNRWLVEGVADKSHRQLALGDDKRGRVYEFFANFIDDPKPMDQQYKNGAMIEDGKFWINSVALSRLWQTYTAETARSDQPSVKQASDILRDMRGDYRKKRVKRSNVSAHTQVVGFSLIDPEYVFDFIDEVLGGDSAAARAAIEASKKK